MGENGNGLVFKVAPWKLFACAWMQKLLSTIISAKVMITLVLIYVSYKLVTVRYVFDVAVSDKVIQVNAPYLSGEQWSNLMATVVVAFIGARLAPTLIQAIGDVLVKAKGGSVEVTTEEEEEKEEEKVG